MIKITAEILTASFWTGVLNVLNKVWPILAALLLFGIVVFIHEFGHFSFAKMFGIKVNEFAIGFGPKIFSKKGKKTDYSLRLLPLGGYCAMEGEDAESSDENAFGNKSIIKRILVVFAGGFFNLILGFILVCVVLSLSGMAGTTTVAVFDDPETSKSYASGLEVGDSIYSINGRRTFTASDVSYMLTSAPDETVDMTVVRGGERKDMKVNFETAEKDGTKYIVMDFKVLGLKTSNMSFFTFMKYVAMDFVSMARVVWMSLFDLITGRFGLNEMMGPVGLVGTVSSAVSSVASGAAQSAAAAKAAFENIVYLITLITINLGIVNLLPLPALDGGRIVLLAAQGITRKKIPPKYEGIIHMVGFALLMVLIVVITFNDILRLFR